MVYKFENIEYDCSVLISDDCIKSMVFELNKHYPKEFGGILVGIKGQKQCIIVDVQTPKLFKASKNSFLRKNDGLNEYLSDLYNKSEGVLEYLGEWHSHPNGTTTYSADDENSMMKLAKDETVSFSKPLLIIFNIKRTEFKMSVYKVFQNKLIILTGIQNLDYFKIDS
jgi:integrative and conjugative element protein (TIGR02256 family)